MTKGRPFCFGIARKTKRERNQQDAKQNDFSCFCILQMTSIDSNCSDKLHRDRRGAMGREELPCCLCHQNFRLDSSKLTNEVIAPYGREQTLADGFADGKQRNNHLSQVSQPRVVRRRPLSSQNTRTRPSTPFRATTGTADPRNPSDMSTAGPSTRWRGEFTGASELDVVARRQNVAATREIQRKDTPTPRHDYVP